MEERKQLHVLPSFPQQLKGIVAIVLLTESLSANYN